MDKSHSWADLIWVSSAEFDPLSLWHHQIISYHSVLRVRK